MGYRDDHDDRIDGPPRPPDPDGAIANESDRDEVGKLLARMNAFVIIFESIADALELTLKQYHLQDWLACCGSRLTADDVIANLRTGISEDGLKDAIAVLERAARAYDAE